MQQVYWINPGQLAGRCGPSKVPWDPAALHQAGIRTVITLASEVPVKADLSLYGLRHERVALSPLPFLLRASQRRFVKRLLPVLVWMHDEIEEGRPTLVHCYDGDDRTGLALSGYLVKVEGLGWQAAVGRVRAANPRAMKMPGYAGAVRWFEHRFL